MKNYFESMTAIMSFKQVERITIYKSSIIAETANCRNEFDIDQLANYKAWLDAQSNSQGNLTSCYALFPAKASVTTCTSSGKVNNSDHLSDVGKMVLTREQVNKVGREGLLQCQTCKHNGRRECKSCNDYIVTDEFVTEINELIKKEK